MMSNRTGRKLATLDRFEFSTYKIDELYIYNIFLYRYFLYDFLLFYNLTLLPILFNLKVQQFRKEL